MSDERNKEQGSQRPGRQIRWTAALLASVVALIYLGFISRGVFG